MIILVNIHVWISQEYPCNYCSSFASDVAPAHCLVPGDAIIANQFQYAPIFIYYSIVV